MTETAAGEDWQRRERDLIQQRQHAAARWPELLKEIRRVPGLEGFGLPPPIAELKSAAAGGTIVAINVTAHGCGAFTLTRRRADYLPLPGLTAELALEKANAFLAALHPEGGTVDSLTMLEVLAWLWDAVAGPVLEHLGYTRSPASPRRWGTRAWPRIWWIPTGPVSVLPLHAAGHHSDTPKRRSVLDRVVSSYTPTVRALSAARQADRRVRDTVLAVGINELPPLPPLAFAEAEAEEVSARLGASQAPLLGPAAEHVREIV